MDILSKELLELFLCYDPTEDCLTYKETPPDYFVSRRAWLHWNRIHAGQQVTTDRIRFQRRTVTYWAARGVMSGEITTRTIREKLAVQLKESCGLEGDWIVEGLMDVGREGFGRLTDYLYAVGASNADSAAQMIGHLMHNNTWNTYDHSEAREGVRNNHYPFSDLQTTADSFFVPDIDLPRSGRVSINSSARSAGIRITTRRCERDGVMGIEVRLKKDKK